MIMKNLDLQYPSSEAKLFQELIEMIEHSQHQVAVQVNSGLTLLFWQVGRHINNYLLGFERAAYGKQIVVTVSRQLTKHYGRNFEEKNLRRMLQFAEQFSDSETLLTISKTLSWSHILVLLPLKNMEAKLFYAQKTSEEILSVRHLRKQISAKIFERTIVGNSQLSVTSGINKNIFKDPYYLDFLQLKDGYLERDLETAILKDLEKFILELGKGFTFVERQKRMIIDGEDFYLDLLFYHRKLKRLVAIELKIDKFHAKYKGQMELYLKWLNRHEREEGEETPIGLILCAETSREQVELLEMHKDGIMVAEYWTELPSKTELEQRLHIALIEAKERIEREKLSLK